jgi:hypothetical protein
MSKKGDRTWRIVKLLTLAVPLPIFLFLSATLFSITADYTITTDSSNAIVSEQDDLYFIYTLDTNATYDGFVVYDDGQYGIVVSSDDIIKFDDGYYSYVEVDGVNQLVDVRRFELQKEQSYKIPLSFFISLGGVLIVALIVQGKMQWHKEHPKGAVLLALITGTVILYVIDLIVSSIFGVFLIATVSWGAYLLEDLIQQGLISQQEGEKTQSDIVRALQEALK